MRRLFLLTALIYVCMTTIPVIGSEISSFVAPYGFRTPLLKQGQYTLNFNPQYYRHESQIDAPSIYLIHSETIQRQYGFSLNGIYALTDGLIFQSSLTMYPGQRRSIYRDVYSYPPDVLTELEIREHSNFTISPGVGVSFRPQANIQFYADFHFSKNKSFYETKDEERFRDLKGEEVYFNLGLTILGRASANKAMEPSNTKLFNFLRPYGFRAPVLSRGQYALNFNSFYVRSESSWDQFSGSEWEKSIWRRYYFSLNGLYALTERLLLQSSLNLYPAQTLQSYDRQTVGSMWDYTELRSDFTVSPNITLSLRPNVIMELFGTFRFTREDLHKDTEFGFQRDQRNDIYYLSVGYTVLGNLSLRTPAPMAGSEFSNFFTPYGFSTPLLEQGQYVLSVGSHYQRTESEEDYPSSSHEADLQSIDRTYYFSLNGVYAVIDKLIIECGLEVFPGQTRVTTRYTWHTDVTNAPTGATEEQRSNFTVSPRLEVCFRPQTNVELYGAFYFNKEKTYMEDRHYDLRNEYFYLDFGFTILGNL